MENLYINYFKVRKFKKEKIHINGPENIFKFPCIGYILKGKCEFHYKGNIYRAKENDLIYISKGTRYYSIWTGEPEIEFYSIGFSFFNSYEKSEYGFQILENYPEHNLHKIYQKRESSPMESLGEFYIFLKKLVLGCTNF